MGFQSTFTGPVINHVRRQHGKEASRAKGNIIRNGDEIKQLMLEARTKYFPL